MKNIIMISLLNIWLISKIISTDIEIYPLNEIGENKILEIKNNKPYYFFSKVADIKINEPISYFISKEIKQFKIGHIFLESDKYEDISKENIQKYSFNEKSEYLDYDNYFKTMFKTDDKQKGLLFTLNIIEFEEEKSFNITRINLTIIDSLNTTILIKSQFNYFYLDIFSYLNQYDIFIFSSNAGKRIKGYYIYSDKENKLESEIFSYLFYTNIYFDEYKYIYIQNNNNEEIYFNVKLLKKKKFIELNKNGMYPIELCFPNSSFNEVYFIGKKSYEYSFFYKELFGKVEGSYIKLSEISNLDNVFKNNNEKMELFEDIRTSEGYTLFYFKCKDNKPSIFEFFININFRDIYISKGSSSYYLTKSKNNNNKEIIIEEDSFNVSISFEYIGCKLEEDESIRIPFGDNELILNQNIKKYTFNNINVTKGSYTIYSNKLCVMHVKFDEYNIPIFSLKEYNNISIYKSPIVFKYPKIKEDNHYILEFFRKNYEFIPDCLAYYDDIDSEKFTINYNIQKGPSIGVDTYIKYNPYKIFESESNLTYYIYCICRYYNFSFNVKILKKQAGILDRVFLATKYTEYIFPEISNKSLILVQSIGNFERSIYGNKEPILSISNYDLELNIYDRYLELYDYLIRSSKGEIPKLVIKANEYYLKLDYINYLNKLNDVKFLKYYNISFDGKDTLTFSIFPFVKNEPIKYTIHIYNESLKLWDIYNSYDYYSEKLNENYGEITINQTFIKNESNAFEYKMNVGKINLSSDRCVIVGKVLNTGYIYYYNTEIFHFQNKSEIKKNQNYLTIILIVIFAILIIIALLAFFIIRKRRRRNNNPKEKNIPGQLLKEKELKNIS